MHSWGETQTDEMGMKGPGCQPPVFPYRAVVMQGQLAEGLPFPAQIPRDLLYDTGHPPSQGREAGETLSAARAGRQGGGTCTTVLRAAPGACAGYPTHASSPPVFLRICCEWQWLSAGWLWLY